MKHFHPQGVLGAPESFELVAALARVKCAYESIPLALPPPPTALAVNSAPNININVFLPLIQGRRDTVTVIHRCNRLLRNGHKLHQRFLDV